jgi:hypothetical protein
MDKDLIGVDGYLQGYYDGIVSGNGLLNARLHEIRMFVEDLIKKTTKPEALEDIQLHSGENK